jgi:hypothetical protein
VCGFWRQRKCCQGGDGPLEVLGAEGKVALLLCFETGAEVPAEDGRPHCHGGVEFIAVTSRFLSIAGPSRWWRGWAGTYTPYAVVPMPRQRRAAKTVEIRGPGLEVWGCVGAVERYLKGRGGRWEPWRIQEVRARQDDVRGVRRRGFMKGFRRGRHTLLNAHGHVLVVYEKNAVRYTCFPGTSKT